MSGYLAGRAAQAQIAIVAQCAFRKDHLLIRLEHAETAIRILTRFSAECAWHGKRPGVGKKVGIRFTAGN